MKIAIAGAGGRMGRTLLEAAAADGELELVAAVDTPGSPAIGQPAGKLRIGSDLSALAQADVVLDFTRPEGTLALLEHAKAVVIGTTGFTEEDKDRIAQAAKRIPIVQAANFAVGVNTAYRLAETAARILGDDYDVEIVLVVELLAKLIEDGTLTPTVPVERTITYHDPCRLNKRKGVWEEPRRILRSIPGLTFHDVDRVTQWSYCSGAGGGLPVEKPELTARISASRMEKAAALDVDTLVSACPWSERPLSEAGEARSIDVVDIHELLAQSLGIEVGGSTGK